MTSRVCIRARTTIRTSPLRRSRAGIRAVTAHLLQNAALTHFVAYSGASTPVSQQPAAYTFIPVMMCNLVLSAGSALKDVCAIPTGTVQQLRTQIEVLLHLHLSGHGSESSWQTRCCVAA